ncbi:Acyl-CoA synthetase (AMP-forming)/AMP-acid ligase II [Geosmithia morbida]|uniref:Acyl-CoA synthetase (AMP-forming)/AMP-acid ligase II n=1 Tax=Geosmithia morbida TaxID=1094350 RepID=A0A9P5D2D0_9HYPO|nr:Acyl-CoA synthetase (AMP-forming)/AMP-acid ligase II [Geosmithia morbida]KAF4119389.1 Acyl-CoA synthetase (AMP-forming)/AMP-acid ligase II [Geosmithia morbida]
MEIPPYLGQSNVFDWMHSNPFSSQNGHTPLDRIVPSIPSDRPIFVDEATDHTLTRSQLRRDALLLATGLQTTLGLNPDETQHFKPTATCADPHIAPVVLIQLPNCLPFATALMGTLAAGLTATLVSPALTASETEWVVRQSRPRACIVTSACVDNVKRALGNGHDTSVPIYTADSLSDLLSIDGDSAAVRQPQSLDASNRAAVMLWSSGTSGRPKGVLLSHRALNLSVASVWHDADFYRGLPERWLGFVPFYHVFGLLNLFLAAVAAGATVYIMPSFNPDAMLSAVRRRRLTYLHMAPPVAVLLAKSPLVHRDTFVSVRAAITGGAPLGHDIIAQVYARLGFRIRMGYGLTEACNVSVQFGLNEHSLHDQAGTTGRAHWAVELAVSSEGEVLVRSPSLMMGYLPVDGVDTSATDEALTHDGWFRTGDVGTLDPQGNLRLTDRIKELIKVRGFQVAPAELEGILCASDDVADAAVVGILDNDSATEWPRAFIVPRSAPHTASQQHDLAHRLRELIETHATRYKWLRGGVVFVDKIPKSPSGKILRRIMRDGGIKGVEVAVYGSAARTSKI